MINANDKYEKILMYMAFGMFGVDVILSLLGNTVGIFKTNPAFPEWLGQYILLFWLIVAYSFGGLVIKKGRKIIKLQKETDIEIESDSHEHQWEVNIVVHYRDVYDKLSRYIKNKKDKGDKKDDS